MRFTAWQMLLAGVAFAGCTALGFIATRLFGSGYVFAAFSVGAVVFLAIRFMT